MPHLFDLINCRAADGPFKESFFFIGGKGFKHGKIGVLFSDELNEQGIHVRSELSLGENTTEDGPLLAGPLLGLEKIIVGANLGSELCVLGQMRHVADNVQKRCIGL